MLDHLGTIAIVFVTGYVVGAATMLYVVIQSRKN